MKSFYELRFFLILWLTQAFSSLGSAMTNFALVLWLYQDSGSALKTAMLTGDAADSAQAVAAETGLGKNELYSMDLEQK